MLVLADGSEKTSGERMKAVKSTAEISDPPPLIDFICNVDEDRMHLMSKLMHVWLIGR